MAPNAIRPLSQYWTEHSDLYTTVLTLQVTKGVGCLNLKFVCSALYIRADWAASRSFQPNATGLSRNLIAKFSAEMKMNEHLGLQNDGCLNFGVTCVTISNRTTPRE